MDTSVVSKPRGYAAGIVKLGSYNNCAALSVTGVKAHQNPPEEAVRYLPFTAKDRLQL
jgi:hypothetical protein